MAQLIFSISLESYLYMTCKTGADGNAHNKGYDRPAPLLCLISIHYPAGTQRLYDIVLTSMQRNDVHRHPYNVLCLLVK